MSNGLEDRLKKALAGRKTIEMGQFQMLNLDMIKAETGDRWIELRKKIYNVAVHFVEKRLHPDDVLVRCRGGFIIVFAHLSGPEAKERVEYLSNELNLFFLGDQILSQLEIRAEARSVSAKELAQVVAQVTRTNASDSVAGGRRSSDPPRSRERKPDPRWKDGEAPDQKQQGQWVDDPDDKRTGARWVDNEVEQRRSKSGSWTSVDKGEPRAEAGLPPQSDGARSAERGEARWSESKTSAKDEAARADTQERLARAKEAWEAAWAENNADAADAGETGKAAGKAPKSAPDKAETSAVAADKAETASKPPSTKPAKPATQSAEKAADWKRKAEQAEEEDLPDLPEAVFTESSPNFDDIVFKPCWDARQNAISTYFCLPRRIRRGEASYGRDALAGDASLDMHRAMDRSVAIAAQRGFQKLYTEGASCAIAIPVHYDSIRAVSDRVSYFSVLQSVPQHLRRFFFLRVDNIPDGAPVSQMEELFRSMKCFGSNLLAKVPFGADDFTTFANCGIDLFGSEVPRMMNDGHISEKSITHLAGMVHAARDRNAEVYLTQVANFEVLNAAVTAGVRYFAGVAVGDEVALPTPVLPCSFSDLQARDRQRRQGFKQAG